MAGNWSPAGPGADKNVLLVQKAMESCVFKAGLSVVGGGALGLAFGMFMGTMPMDDPIIGAKDGKQPTLREAFRTQMKLSLTLFNPSETGKASLGYAKSFAVVGGLFSSSECAIDSYRAKHDIYSAVGAGCISGAVLAYNTGPRGIAAGCAGFAAFSAAIEHFFIDRE